MRTAHRFLWIMLAFVVVSCNYGGGNGMRAASATLTVDPTEITLGQSATLTWSTNGAGCTASGDWSGAQDASGTLTVTPDTAGAHMYSLVCTGGSYGNSNMVSATLTVDAAASSAFSMSAHFGRIGPGGDDRRKARQSLGHRAGARRTSLGREQRNADLDRL